MYLNIKYPAVPLSMLGVKNKLIIRKQQNTRQVNICQFVRIVFNYVVHIFLN